MTEQHSWNGTFEEKPFPTLLVEIRDSGKTGILLVQKEEVEKRIFFQNGEPVASRSNNRRELIGEILYARGKISKAQLDEAVQESKKKSGENFGQILVQKEFLAPKDLYSECKYQFISVLFSLFPWDSGTFSFQAEEASSLIPPDLPRFHVKFSKLLSEGIRVIKDEGLMDRLLGDPGHRVRPASVSIPSQDLSFKGADRTVLDALGGGKTIQEVCSSLPLDPLLAKKVLYTLSCLGGVEIQGPVPEGEVPAEPSFEAEEELPALSESSLSAFMTDIMPEQGAENLPVFEEEGPSVPESEVIAGSMGEEDQVLRTAMGQGETEEVPEVPEGLDFGMEDSSLTEALEEEEGVTVQEEDLSAPVQEGPVEEERAVPASPEKAPEEGPVTQEQGPPAQAVSDNLSKEEEKIPVKAEPKRASRPPMKKVMMDRTTSKRKKKSYLLPLVAAAGIVVLLAVLALLVYPKFKEPGTLLVARGGQEAPVTGEVKAVRPAEVPEVEEKQEVTEPAAGLQPPAPEEAGAEPEGPAATEKEAGPTPAATPQAERVPEEKIEALPPPTPSWEDAYARGLKNFREGNLKSAFREWSDVIRVAPEHTYTIQIEISSYLNFASKDIEEASRGEQVFIVPIPLENKSLYRVLCGIYPDRPEAEAALKGLTPYLKAQKPAVVGIDALKKRLAD